MILIHNNFIIPAKLLNLQIMTDVQKFSGMIDRARKICLVTHTHPDGDAIGSTGAMYHYLRRSRNADVTIVLPDILSDTLSFAMPMSDCGTAAVQYDAGLIAGADLLICLDFNVPSRAAALEGPILKSGAVKVLIDHHLNPQRESFDLVFSQTEISSASEVLYGILMQMPDIDGDISKLPLEAASSLMVGMTTDTNNFANSVYPSTLAMASALLGRGVDRDAIIGHIYNEYRQNRVRAMAYLLDNHLTITPNGVAYIIIDSRTKQRFDLREGETEGLVNVPLSVKEVRLSILLTQDDGYFRVSIRSKKGTSANALATRHYHGGGHECASGGRLYFPNDIATPQDAAAYIEKTTSQI